MKFRINILNFLIGFDTIFVFEGLDGAEKKFGEKSFLLAMRYVLSIRPELFAFLMFYSNWQTISFDR